MIKNGVPERLISYYYQLGLARNSFKEYTITAEKKE